MTGSSEEHSMEMVRKMMALADSLGGEDGESIMEFLELYSQRDNWMGAVAPIIIRTVDTDRGPVYAHYHFKAFTDWPSQGPDYVAPQGIERQRSTQRLDDLGSVQDGLKMSSDGHINEREEDLVRAGEVLLTLIDDYMSVTSLTANERYKVALAEFRNALSDAKGPS